MELSLPWLQIVAAAAAALFVVWLGFRLKVDERWNRIVVRLAIAGVSLPFWLGSVFLLTAHGCEGHGPLIESPNGKYVARKLVYGSAIQDDFLTVIVRRSWSPIWHEAFTGNGGEDRQAYPNLPEPRVNWVDDSHLVIDYPSEGVYLNTCNRVVGDILVECKSHSR